MRRRRWRWRRIDNRRAAVVLKLLQVLLFPRAGRTCKREEHVSWSRAVSYHLIGLITFYRVEVVVLYDSVKIPRCRSRSRNMNDLFAIYLRLRALPSRNHAAR